MHGDDGRRAGHGKALIRNGERLNLFIIANELGRTVGELETRLTITEYLEWIAFFEWKSAQEKKAMDKAKANNSIRRRR